MSSAEINLGHHEALNPNEAIIDRLDFVIDGQSFAADIGTSKDDRLGEARKIEESTFEFLGDIPEEVEEEFDPHDPYATFIFLHKGERLANGNPSGELVGMGRFIPYNEAFGGLKTFVDLGKIAAQGVNDNDTDNNSSSRFKILKSLDIDPDSLSAFDSVEERADFITGVVEKKFREGYDTEDLSKLLDIATLAPDVSLEFEEKILVIDGLLAAMAVHTTDLYRQGKLTHLVQFTAGALHHYLRDIYGYPIEELFDLSDISYDSFGNGSDDNMISTPSVLVSEKLVNDVFMAPNPSTEHLGKISWAMAQVNSSRDTFVK